MPEVYCANESIADDVSGNAPIADLHTVSGEFCVTDIDMICNSGPSLSTWGVGRGVLTAPVNARACPPDRPGPFSRTKYATKWGLRPPTIPTRYIRRTGNGGAANNAAQIIYTFPRGWIFTPASTLLLWNATSTFGTTGIHFNVIFTE